MIKLINVLYKVKSVILQIEIFHLIFIIEKQIVK